MKISYSWLKDFIDIQITPTELAKELTSAGLEVESIEEVESIKGGAKGLVLGQVITCERHPNADKLSVTTVNIGNDLPIPIVCGAPNVAVGQKVIVATVGSTVFPVTGESFKISKSKIRGEVSEGMICAEDEIGIGQSHDGIMVIETDLPIGTPAAKVLGLGSDWLIEIGLTPNRADAASHLGVARDIKALLKQKGIDVSLNLPIVENVVQGNTSAVSIEIFNNDACKRYTGLVIEGIKVSESPKWLKDRLSVIGVNSINNVVDATNYVLHDLGQPLHAFDWSEVKGSIKVKNCAEGTIFKTLDTVERKLAESDLMICNADEPMCLAGVFGGANSGVKESTNAIFLESAYFSPNFIRKSSQKHGLKTDSSFRFERGTDPNMPLFALKRAAKLIVEIAGGTITSPIYDVYPEAVQNFKFDIDVNRITSLIGISLSVNEVKSILNSLEIEILKENQTILSISVPPYRVDVQREADIAEEVLRIYGIDNIPLIEEMSAGYLANFPEKDTNSIRETISNVLVDNGFVEIMTNSLTKPIYAEKLSSISKEEDVVILNKLSEDLAVMRQTILFSGLEAIAYNVNRKQKDVRLFEIAKTYHKKDSKYQENTHLAIWITGSSNETWIEKSKSVDFHVLASEVIKICTKLGINDYTSTVIQDDVFAEGLELKRKNLVFARLGKVTNDCIKLADLKQATYFADLNWDLLIKWYSDKFSIKEISKFPEVRRDLSLVLDKKVTFAEINALALKTEKKLLQRLNVFDVYEGANLGENKKSYSVSFILQDNETLTDQQIDAVMTKLISTFEKELNAVIRK